MGMSGLGVRRGRCSCAARPRSGTVIIRAEAQWRWFGRHDVHEPLPSIGSAHMSAEAGLRHLGMQVQPLVPSRNTVFEPSAFVSMTRISGSPETRFERAGNAVFGDDIAHRFPLRYSTFPLYCSRGSSGNRLKPSLA